MARPLLDALAAADPTPDTSLLFAFASGGAILSPATKAQIAELLPNVLVIDAFGSSETGLAGSKSSGADDTGSLGPVHRRRAHRRARRRLPAGRARAPGSSAGSPARATCRSATTRTRPRRRPLRRGRRRALGAPRRHGDGRRPTAPSCCSAGARARSTPAARRSSPRRSRRVLKGHPAVLRRARRRRARRALGRDGRRRRAARGPGTELTLEELTAFAREGLAGYKLPRRLVLVDEVQRAANGKPDYAWAKAAAAGA